MIHYVTIEDGWIKMLLYVTKGEEGAFCKDYMMVERFCESSSFFWALREPLERVSRISFSQLYFPNSP